MIREFYEGVVLLKLAKDAHRLFEKTAGKREVENAEFLLSNRTWANGELSAEIKQLFDSLAKAEMPAAQASASKMGVSAWFEIMARR